YYPAQYFFPPDPLAVVNSIGFDSASSPLRNNAMMRSIHSGLPSLSEKVRLVFNITGGTIPGVILYFPYYGQRTNATIDAHQPYNNYNNNSGRYPLLGFVAGSYDLESMFTYALRNLSDADTLIQAWDVTNFENQTQLFRNPSLNGSEPGNIDGGGYDTSFTKNKTFSLADRTWRISCTPTMSDPPATYAPTVILVVVIIFFILIAVLIRNFAKQYLSARRRVSLQNFRLGKTHGYLQAITQDSKAILQSIADPIVALDRFGYVVGANEHALRVTGYSNEEIGENTSRMHISQLLIPTSTHPTPAPSPPRSRATSVVAHPDTLATPPPSTPPTTPLPHVTLTMDITDALSQPLPSGTVVGDDVELDSAAHPADSYPLPSFPLRSGMREMFARRKDGGTFEVQANFSDAALKNNHFTQVVSFRDISSQKKAEREVLESKMRAEEADRSKSEFLFFLCHEIRNPTHAITNLASMLYQKMAFDSDAAARYDLECIITSANFMSALVSDILDLTRLTQADLTVDLGLKNEQFNLRAVFENVKRMVDGRHSTGEGDMDSEDGASSFDGSERPDITCLVDDAVDASPLYGDEYRLQQALSKMVDWVEETSTTGRREIKLGARVVGRHPVKGVHVRFSAEDAEMVEAGTPYGGAVEVEEEEVVVDMEDIFKPYSRAHTSLGARFHASGFGMALAKRIVEVMGGTLRAKSRTVKHAGGAGKDNVGGGTRVMCGTDFEVWLPTQEAMELREGKVYVPRRPVLKSARSFRDGNEIRAKSEPSFASEEPLAEVEAAETTRRWSHSSTQVSLKKFGGIGTKEEEQQPAGVVGTTATEMEKKKVGGESIAQRLDESGPASENGSNMELRELTRVPSSPMGPPPAAVAELALAKTINMSRTSTVSSVTEYRSPLSRPASMHRPTSPPYDITQHRNTSSTASLRVPPHSPSFGPHDIHKLKKVESLHLTPSESKSSRHSASIPTSPPPTSYPARVLLVEDNLICQRVTKKMLERNDFVVTVANNGQEAVDTVLALIRSPTSHHHDLNVAAWAAAVEGAENKGAGSEDIAMAETGKIPEEPFSCVLMDIMTPLLTGYEAAKLLRQNGVKMPIIALTANSFAEDMKHAEEVGMDGFLTKPVTEKALVAAVREEIAKFARRNGNT
ncbi:hypothetical protein BC936DRAFT_141035, partial [Jimgerdemannia flammicorona]